MKKMGNALFVTSLLACQNPLMADEVNSSELSLDEILNLNVGSLLGGSNEEAPATIHTYSAKEIKASTANDLSQFIARKVPGSDVRANIWNNNAWGFRGIITDRAENTLVNVNGEMQNLRSRDGIVGESFLGLMDDIAQVDVVVGPGSVIHGPGAIAGVVNLELKDGRKEKGNGSVELKSNLGVKNDGSMGRSIQGSQISRWDSGNSVLRLSAGYKYEQEAKGQWGGFSQNGLFPANHKHDGREFNNNRLTGVYTNEALKLRAWFRYYNAAMFPKEIATDAVDWDSASTNAGKFSNRGFQQKNLSLSVDKKMSLNSKTELKLTAGYTTAQSMIVGDRDNMLVTDTSTRIDKGGSIESIKETRARVRADLTNRSIEVLPWAVGAEVRKDFMGKGLFGNFIEIGESLGNTNSPSKGLPFVAKNYTNMALFGETQYVPNANIKAILGARYDKHTINSTFAPRVATVFTTDNKRHTSRLVWQKAFKTGSADSMETNRFSSVDAKTTKYGFKPSENSSVEAAYKFNTGAFDVGATLYTNDLTLYTWDDTNKVSVVKSARDYGSEVILGYKTGDFKYQLSHSYVTLEDTKKAITAVTVSGKDFINFNPNITRFSASAKIKGWDATLTGAYFWGLTDRKKLALIQNSATSVNQTTNNATVTQYGQNQQWLYASSFKLDLNLETKVGPGSLGFDIKNIFALVNVKHTLDQKLYDGGSYGTSYSNNAAFTEDQFSLKAYYAYDF